jgi:hypothetical protein
MYSQQGARPPSQHFAPNPPLPHQPQAHYYGLPDLKFGRNNMPNVGLQPGEGGYFCGFDTLATAGDEAARSSENVLLVGSQGGIDVFRIDKSKMDLMGHLAGLRGAVIGAKILPWTSRRDPLASSRPLIALILHGPVVKDSRSSSGSGSSSVVDDSSDAPSRPSSRHGTHGQISGYQTTIEVYSLKEKRRLATLYKAPLVPLTSPIDSPLFQPPPPVGDFVIDAKGKFIVAASGASGEVFVFAPYIEGHDDHPERFRCIGKIWTSVQNRERVTQASSSSTADGSHDEIPPEKYGLPVFSLSGRWLAITPPASSSLYPVNGVALTSPYYERAPGLAYHSAPPQPSTNCVVDTPEAAGLIDRLAREGTQVAIKSAQWAAEKGIQAFKSYMNKGPQGSHTSYSQDPMQNNQFPPTHGHNQTQPRQEASVISVYDLQRLMEAEETRSKNALHPIATIPATLGCSFLSFAPSGLMLMTVSKKGDYQHVWDLKRMNFRRARKTTREQPIGPHVRQVAHFNRMTVANVIDVIWSAPRVDKLAVLTDRGTVHMNPIPASAFQWPPARRIRLAAPLAKPKETTSTTSPAGAVNTAMQALGSANHWFGAVRAGNINTGSRLSLSGLGVTPAAGAKSGKAVAAGVGKSISNLRHAGDNKMTLPSSPSGIKPYSVRWLSGRGRGSIALVSGGVLQIWRVQMRPAAGKSHSSSTASITKKKVAEFPLAFIPDLALPSVITEQLFPQPGDPETTQEYSGEWLPRILPHRRVIDPSPVPLSFSEIETNPPYQPFYTDNRVTRFVYARQSPEDHDSNSEYRLTIPDLVSDLHHEDDGEPWLFGESVEAARISSPVTQAYESGEDDIMADVTARIENKMVLHDGEEEVEQVVVTTRRRRVKRDGAEEGEEGFFEDDCEVLDFAEDRV